VSKPLPLLHQLVFSKKSSCYFMLLLLLLLLPWC
jgi:hypothetical protein